MLLPNTRGMCPDSLLSGSWAQQRQPCAGCRSDDNHEGRSLHTPLPLLICLYCVYLQDQAQNWRSRQVFSLPSILNVMTPAMKTLSSTPDLISRYSILGRFAVQNFAPRPTFHGVVARLFKDALKEKYPSLNVDFAQLSIAEPFPYPNSIYASTNGEPQAYRLMAPVDMMIQSFIDSAPVNLVPGFHRLTTEPVLQDTHPLAVNMDDVEQIINDHSPFLIDFYQQALTFFWSEASNGNISPFQWLVQTLQTALSVSALDKNRVSALSNDEAVALAVVASFPDKVERLKSTEETPLHAYLVNIQLDRTNAQRFYPLPGVMVVTREMPDRTLVLSYSQSQGIEQHTSLEAFGMFLAASLRATVTTTEFTWRLYEPLGNFFSALALTMLDSHTQDIKVLGEASQSERWSVERLAQVMNNAGEMFQLFSKDEQSYFKHVLRALPEWLSQAGSKDQLAYSKLMVAQVTWQKQVQGQTFLDGIEPLQEYAKKILTLRILEDYPQSTIDVSEIEVHDVFVENLQFAIFTEEVSPLPEFALKYIGGKPAGLMSIVHYKNQPLPTWLTSHYIKGLLSELDIGSEYIKLIKRLLIDDAAEVVRRKALFISQLRVQLSLLALEKKIKGESGFTDKGWLIVLRLMRDDSEVPVSNGQLCVRLLGFHAYDGSATDFVSNMFVFGAVQIESGPFILYRPFADEPLLEFATWTALMDAIKSPGELQELILAWLDDRARRFYVDGGFQRPHLEGVTLEGFMAVFPRDPATIDTQCLEGNYFEAMFDSNANALVTLADKQTVSTSERRWILFKRYAWTVFNGLTFFVSGPLQKAAWIFQTLMSLDEGLEARIDGDKDAATQTVIDLLFNIALALLHEGLTFKAQANERIRSKAPVDEPIFELYSEKKIPQASRVNVPAPAQKQMAEIISPNYPELDFSWFSPQRHLTQNQQTVLDTFAVDIDLTQGTQIEVGPLKGVIDFQGKSFVQMAGKIYQVSRDVDGLVIQDDNQPLRLGPRLRSNEAGQWSVDLRLGLRGGGPKKRIQQKRADIAKQIGVFEEEAEQLMENYRRRERLLDITDALMEKAPERHTQLLERYESEFKEWLSSAKEVIRVADMVNTIAPLDHFEKILKMAWSKIVVKQSTLQVHLETELHTLPVSHLSSSRFSTLNDAIKKLEDGDRVPYEHWVNNLKQAEKIEERLFKNAVRQREAIAILKVKGLQKDSTLTEMMSKPSREYFAQYWAAGYLETLNELLTRPDESELLPEEQLSFDFFANGSLVDTALAQMSLGDDDVAPAREHIEVLESAIKQYNLAEGICFNLMELHSEHFRNEYLPSMISTVLYLRAFAEEQLSILIQTFETPALELEAPRPGPSRLSRPVATKPASSTSQKKVFKTTDKQTLIGVRRDSSSDSSGEIVDVTEGISNLIVHSYRKTEDNEWQVIESTRLSTAKVSHSKTLTRLEADARVLLGRVESALRESRAYAARSKIAVEIEEILVFKGRSLDEAARQIDQVVNASSPDIEPLPAERKTTAMALSAELKSNAERLREEGKKLRIEIIKRLPPTGPGVEYLKDQGEVNITQTGPRRHLSKGLRKDYLQEYSIRGMDGKALWFAHFHYATADALANDFEVAHLKTAEQRRLSEQALYAKAQSAHEYVEIYRAKLDRTLATRLFLLSELGE